LNMSVVTPLNDSVPILKKNSLTSLTRFNGHLSRTNAILPKSI